MTASFPTPSLLRRLAGMVYESLLLFGVLAVGFLAPQILLSAAVRTPTPAWVSLLHIFALLMLYFLWFWLNDGRTLAMKTWKMRIVDQSGQPLRPAQALLRYLAAWPSVLCFGIGILWALVDKDKQFLHDRIAGSRIIFKE